MKITKMPL